MFKTTLETERVHTLFKLGLMKKNIHTYKLLDNKGKTIGPIEELLAEKLIATYESFSPDLRYIVNHLNSTGLRKLVETSVEFPSVIGQNRAAYQKKLEARLKPTKQRPGRLIEAKNTLNELRLEMQDALDKGKEPMHALSLAGQSLGIYTVLQKYYSSPISIP